MEKVRVYELARDLGITSPQAIQLLKEKLQLRVKSASSTIEEEVAIKLKRLMRLESKEEEFPAGAARAVSIAARRAERARQAIIDEAEREEAERLAQREREIAERRAAEEAAREAEAARLAAEEAEAARLAAEAAEAEAAAAAAEEEVEAGEPEIAAEPSAAVPTTAEAPSEPPVSPPAPSPAPAAPVAASSAEKAEMPPAQRPAASAAGERPRPAPARPGFVPGPTSTVIRPPLRPTPPARQTTMKAIPPPPRPAAPIKRVSWRKPEGKPKPGPREPRVPQVEAKEQRLPEPKVPEKPKPELPQVFRKISLTEGVTVKELSEKMEVKHKDLIRSLMNRGILATINQTLDTALAVEVAREFGCEAEILSFEEDVVREEAEVEAPGDLITRAPVVTVMGHVDHGKTSLLDAIRQTKVVEQEAGGITQHIGAYKVAVDGRSVVFLDTPGHEAFTMMRARGARVTDLVVLVVAADDGVMPQTQEAIDHARAAGVPLLVAINKIDKPGANAERVRKQLADLGLMPEAWGGSTVFCEVSAKQRQGLDLLLEMILLVSDIQDLKANPGRAGMGTVLEAKIDKGKGPVAHVLIQNGTVSVGDSFIAGAVHGKVRAMLDDRGHKVKKVLPSTPVEILGLTALPQAGDQFQVIADSFKARQIGEFRQQKLREQQLSKSARLTLEQLSQQVTQGLTKELPIVLKADVQGSVEVLSGTLAKLSTEKVKVRIIHASAGAITETDILLASASNAIVVGFNVRPEKGATELAEKEGVDVRLHTIIYNVTDEIKKAMSGLLEPTFREVEIGRAEVRDTFRVPKVGTVAGCYVTDGKVTRGAEARLLRDNVVIYQGKIGSLRRFKEDAAEVKQDFECGIGLTNFNDIKVGDVIEVFAVERVEEKAVT
jgi:translation initiation factor IF-2